MKTMAKSHAWLGWSIPCCTSSISNPQAVQDFPAPFAAFSSEGLPDFQLQGRRLQSLVTRPKWQFFHVDCKNHSQNKVSSLPDKLKSMLKMMRLVRVCILAGCPDFICFSAQTQQCVFPCSRSLNCFSAVFPKSIQLAVCGWHRKFQLQLDRRSLAKLQAIDSRVFIITNVGKPC